MQEESAYVKSKTWEEIVNALWNYTNENVRECKIQKSNSWWKRCLVKWQSYEDVMFTCRRMYAWKSGIQIYEKVHICCEVQMYSWSSSLRTCICEKSYTSKFKYVKVNYNSECDKGYKKRKRYDNLRSKLLKMCICGK